jgi:lysyl-tRNA synthetase class 2
MKPEKKSLNLNEAEKSIYVLIKKNESNNLNKVKEDSNLSNKAWDKGIKNLVKNNLVKVVKSNEGLFIQLVN